MKRKKKKLRKRKKNKIESIAFNSNIYYQIILSTLDFFSDIKLRNIIELTKSNLLLIAPANLNIFIKVFNFFALYSFELFFSFSYLYFFFPQQVVLSFIFICQPANKSSILAFFLLDPVFILVLNQTSYLFFIYFSQDQKLV